MKKFFSEKLWRLISVILLTLTVIIASVYDVALKNESVVNHFLGISASYGGDVEYSANERFPSDFNSNDEVTAYAKEVAEEVEGEGLVLIKNNNNALPLSAGDNVSTILQTSVNLNYGSSGSSAVGSDGYVDLKTALTNVGLKVNETLWNFYKTDSNATSSKYSQKCSLKNGKMTYSVNALPLSMYSDEAKNSISENGGTALVTIGRLSGEGKDVSAVNSDGLDGSYLSLTEEETEILKELTTLKNSGKINNIVVLLNTALAFKTDFLNDSVSGIDVDAAMWIGNVGITGINAVAKALVGKITPSGKLSDTYVKDNFSSPAMMSQMFNDDKYFSAKYNGYNTLKSSTQWYYGVYTEGIYVGYKYYETRYEDVVLGTANVGDYDYSSVVSYPFGYGLSYASFEYSDYSVVKTAEGDYEVKVKVTNTDSTYSGKEVVEVYLQKPYTDYDRTIGVEKSAIELVGFSKTKLLAPSDFEVVTITIEKELFKTYDSYGYKTYILEEGDYYLAVGTSAHSALNNVLVKKGKTTVDGMTEEGNASLALKVGEDIVLDTITYSTSKETGSKITNKLDFCDINVYDTTKTNSVTYVTRNDWANSLPKAKVEFTLTDKLKNDLNSNNKVDTQAGKTAKYGENNSLSVSDMKGLDLVKDAEKFDKLVEQMTYAEQAKLITSAYFGTTGIASINLPQTKADDGPTGVSGSTTTDGVSFPSEGIWASSFNVEIIAKVGDALAEEARAAGNVGMYLPGVNIHRTPFGGRAHEYFSEDSLLSGISCEAEVKAVQKKGVIPYVKHFVFNEQEDNRNGVGVWLNEQSAREIYLRVYEYATAKSRGNAHGVMSSFNRAGAVWTGASSALQNDILRGEFGFDGVILTDMASGNGLFYITYYDGFMNGTDLFLGAGQETSLDEFSTDEAFKEAMATCVKRHIYVTANFVAVDLGEVTEVVPFWRVALVTSLVALISLCVCAIVFTVTSYILKYQKK